jgi:ATP-dependent DNA ligase
MLCSPAERLPIGDRWSYEPKLDGFRGLLVREGHRVDLRSRNDRSLADYFPEVIRTSSETLPRSASSMGKS